MHLYFGTSDFVATVVLIVFGLCHPVLHWFWRHAVSCASVFINKRAMFLGKEDQIAPGVKDSGKASTRSHRQMPAARDPPVP